MGVGVLLSTGDNYMLWKGQPWLVLGNRGELLSAFWKAGAMLERGWREPLMGLAEKWLLMRRISVNFEVSHARISTIVVTSRMRKAEMTYLVRKEAYVWGQDPFKGNNAWDLDEKLLAPCLSGLKIKHLSKVYISSSGSFPELCYMCSFHISVADRTCPLWNAVPTFMCCESLWGMEPLFAPGFRR